MDRRDLGIACGLFVLAIAWFALTATRTLDLRDEGYLLAQAAKVAGGALPHRDFSDVYGPGALWLSGLALWLGDGAVWAVRLLVVLSKASGIAAGFALARQVAPRWAAVAASCLAIAYRGRLVANLNAPYAAIFTLPLALLAGALVVQALVRRQPAMSLAAGVAAGAAVLTKQSLGLMAAYGLLLSIVAIGALRRSRDGDPGLPERIGLTIAWGVACAAVALPLASRLDPLAYAVHIAPIHALGLLVALACWRRGGPAWPGPTERNAAIAFAAGSALLPACTVAMYLATGGLGALFGDMFLLPLSLERYALPIALPPLALVAVLAGVVALVSAALTGLARRRATALGLAATGGVLLVVGLFVVPSPLPRLFEPAILLGRAALTLEGVLLPLLLAAALGFGARQLLRDEAAPLPERWVPAVMLSAVLAFEVFPRAGTNLWVLHGALAPLFAFVLAQWARLAECAERPRGGIAAVAATLVVPLWLVAPLVPDVAFPAEPRAEARALAAPHLQGLAFAPGRIGSEDLDDVEALLAWLATREPAEASLLVLTNEEMLPWLAERPAFLDERRYDLFLAGWGMLPPERAAEVDDAAVDRLRDDADVIVVHRNDPSAAHFRATLPRLAAAIASDFAPVERFGPYRVLRARSRPGAGGDILPPTRHRGPVEP